MAAAAPPMTDAGAPASGASEAVDRSATPLADLRPPPGVALAGRRLQRGVPWKSVLIMAGVIAIWLLSQSGFFGMFSR